MATITADEPRDIVATATAALGFHPTDSLVVLCLRAPRHRVGLVMRLDLDAITNTTSAAHTATRITHHADAVVLLAFTDDPATARRTTALMSTALVDTRHPVHEALWVSADAYGSLTCPDPHCCPVDG